MPKATCSRHPKTALQCPRCIASRGGKKTAKIHAKKLVEWGRRGGRPRARQGSNL